MDILRSLVCFLSCTNLFKLEKEKVDIYTSLLLFTLNYLKILKEILILWSVEGFNLRYCTLNFTGFLMYSLYSSFGYYVADPAAGTVAKLFISSSSFIQINFSFRLRFKTFVLPTMRLLQFSYWKFRALFIPYIFHLKNTFNLTKLTIIQRITLRNFVYS